MRSQPDAGPPHPCQKTMQSARWAKILCYAREPREHFVLFFDRDGRGASILPAVRRATIPVKKQCNTHFAAKSGSCVATPRSLSSVFYRGGRGAGIWPAVCRPTRHHDGHPAAIAHWFSTRMVGADMVPDVCRHVRRRTWHTLRVPRTWRTWRGWSMRHTWRTWST